MAIDNSETRNRYGFEVRSKQRKMLSLAEHDNQLWGLKMFETPQVDRTGKNKTDI